MSQLSEACLFEGSEDDSLSAYPKFKGERSVALVDIFDGLVLAQANGADDKINKRGGGEELKAEGRYRLGGEVKKEMERRIRENTGIAKVG
jgi:hypothetical protein